MAIFKIKKGLDIPIAGEPKQEIFQATPPSRVALLSDDYHGLKAGLMAKVGDRVKKGQALFFSRKNPDIKFTSPSSGIVEAIERGDKRRFVSMIVRREGNEACSFTRHGSVGAIKTLSPQSIKETMLASGLWTAVRQRPFARIADPLADVSSFFVTAMDSHPLAPDVSFVVNKRAKDFEAGLAVLSRLMDGRGPVHVCHQLGKSLPHGESPWVVHHQFAGPNPAGLVGTHIHYVDPVRLGKNVWYIGAQDVVSLGHLFLTGEIDSTRVVSLAGPQVKEPRLLRTELGADLNELTRDELENGENRIVSGSIVYGHDASKAKAFLGRYHQGVAVLEEDRTREFQGFLSPGFNKFSVKPIFASRIFSNKKFRFGTNRNGSLRDVVPIGSYEAVMPLDVIPTFLVRSILSGDTEKAEQLGVLELDGEDMALCTYVCPGKNELSQKLEKVLDELEKELV